MCRRSSEVEFSIHPVKCVTTDTGGTDFRDADFLWCSALRSIQNLDSQSLSICLFFLTFSDDNYSPLGMCQDKLGYR